MTDLPETLAKLAGMGDETLARGGEVSGYTEIAMVLRDILKRLDVLDRRAALRVVDTSMVEIPVIGKVL
jgi:hypothetical protein